MIHTISTRIPKADSEPVNMPDYQTSFARFDWASIRAEFAGLPNGGLNIAHEAVMRHANGALAQTPALRWLDSHGEPAAYTYAELAGEVARFANLLDTLGVAAGDRVCWFTGRLPHLYVTALGTLAHRSVFVPLYADFGPASILARMQASRTKLVVTTERMYTRTLAPLRDRLPDLEHVLLLDRDLDHPPPAGTRSLVAALRQMSDVYTIPPTDPEDPALLHFTNGTTDKPKGVVHVHEAVISHHITGRLALDLRPGDTYWCTGDPGWLTGTAYGIIAPLSNGVTVVVDDAQLDARRCYQILEQREITVWYTDPEMIRRLMRAGVGLAREHDLSQLRFIACVGEPLDPEAVRWGIKAFGQAIHDNWWQSETGGIMVANYASMPVVPGSMGKPMPGIEIGVVTRESGGVQAIIPPGVTGELAVRTPWPSMFRAYLGQTQRYNSCFADGWYLTGDLVSRDAEGYLWFVGRADEVIMSGGQLVGPFEVESTLREHPAVSEIAIIGKPDAANGQIIKAFVVLAPGFAPREALRRELLGFGRARLGQAAAPHELVFSPELPKTPGGKPMRRLLAARELGDTSALAYMSDE